MEDNKELEQALQEEDITNAITFDIETLLAYSEVSEPDTIEFKEGVRDVSRYIGQFTALINAGISSEYALQVMEWIYNERLVIDNNKAQIEVVKNQKVAIDKERI